MNHNVRDDLEVRNTLHQLSLEINALIYEAFQISIWLFLATLGCASLGDGNYRNVAFAVT